MKNANTQEDPTEVSIDKNMSPPPAEELADYGKPEETEISGEELEMISGGRCDGHRPPPLGRPLWEPKP